MRYYVYHLIDPRDGLTFYVGKGQSSRIDAHEREALIGRVSRKCDVIRDIWACGRDVVKVKVQHFDREEDAYEFEASEVETIGLDNLTNVVPGGGFVRRKIARQAKERHITVKGLDKIAPQLANYYRLRASGGRILVAGADIAPVMDSFISTVCERLGRDAFVSAMGRHNVEVHLA